VRRAVAATLAALAVAGCGALGKLGLSEPAARVTGARLDQLGLESVTLVLDVEIENPYAVDLPLAGIELSLASGGAPFLESEVHAPTPIPARGAATVPVPATVRFADLAKAAAGAKPGSVVPYAAEIAILASVPGAAQPLRLPVRHEGSLPIPAPPSVVLERLRWETLRLDLAAATIDFRVGNPNSFAIDLRGLAYGLDFAGKTVARGGVPASGAIEPGGAKTFPVRITFAPIDLGTAAFGMLQGERADYALNGRVAMGTTFGAWEQAFETKGKLPLSR